MALLDVVRDNHDLVATNLHRNITDAIVQQKFQAIVLPERTHIFSWISDLAAQHYNLSHTLDGPNMLTGWNVHEVQVWVPRSGVAAQ